jgi:hypothetical protein
VNIDAPPNVKEVYHKKELFLHLLVVMQDVLDVPSIMEVKALDTAYCPVSSITYIELKGVEGLNHHKMYWYIQ